MKVQLLYKFGAKMYVDNFTRYSSNITTYLYIYIYIYIYMYKNMKYYMLKIEIQS
jgi:hypothetical protein